MASRRDLNKQFRFRLSGERENGGKAKYFIDMSFDRARLNAHIFQSGAAGNQPKPSDEAGFVEHFRDRGDFFFFQETSHFFG